MMYEVRKYSLQTFVSNRLTAGGNGLERPSVVAVAPKDPFVIFAWHGIASTDLFDEFFPCGA